MSDVKKAIAIDNEITEAMKAISEYNKAIHNIIL